MSASGSLINHCCARRLQDSRANIQALTLVELLVVLVMLAAVAGVISTLFSNGITVRGTDGVVRTPEEIVTLSTMRTLREVLVGSAVDEPGYRQDLGVLPSRLGGLIENIDGEAIFDPAIKRGWRGPYILNQGHRYGDNIETGDGFVNDPSVILTYPTELDGWGKPIVLQQPDTNEARIVSAGANRLLETDQTTTFDADRGDDLVLYLLSNDPNL